MGATFDLINTGETLPEVIIQWQEDGNYTVQIRVEYAGKNGLYICEQKVVQIWGSMYDDFYTAPVPLDLR